MSATRVVNWAIVLLGAVIGSSFATRSSLVAAPSTAPAKPDVEALIRQLSADEWRQRESAQEQLVLLGQDARQPLERLLGDPARDEETRSRAEAALAQIAENESIGASIVTLRVRNARPQEIFERLSRQCYATLEPFTPDFWQQHGVEPLSLDIDHQPFWVVMKQITQKTGIGLQQWDSGLRLAMTGGQDLGPQTVSGPFVIIANRVARSQAIELGAAQQATDEFSVGFTAMAEPKLRLLRAEYVARLEEAVDDRGNSLIPEGQNDSGEGFVESSAGVWSFQSPLVYPKQNPGRRIVRLKGTIGAVLQTKFEKIEFTDVSVARGTSKTGGGVRAVVNELRKNAEQYELSMVIYPDRFAPADWERIQSSLSSTDVVLLDDKGNTFMRSGYTSNGGNEKLEVTMQFVRNPWLNAAGRTGGEPSRLIWNIPTASKDVRIPFEFSGLPIP